MKDNERIINSLVKAVKIDIERGIERNKVLESLNMIIDKKMYKKLEKKL